MQPGCICCMPVIGADRAPRLCGVKSVEWLASLQAVAHASHALIVNIHNHPWCLRRLRVPDMNKPYHFPRSSSLLCAGCTYHAFTNSPSQGYCAAEGGQASSGLSTTDFNAFHDCGSGETDLSQAQCEQAATAFADATGCGLACMQVRAGGKHWIAGFAASVLHSALCLRAPLCCLRHGIPALCVCGTKRAASWSASWHAC